MRRIFLLALMHLAATTALMLHARCGALAYGGEHIVRCAAPLLAAGSAISSVALMRQSEVLEVLSNLKDVGLANPADAMVEGDIVTLNLVRRIDIDEEKGGVTIELELPADAASTGTGDRVRESDEREARTCARQTRVGWDAHGCAASTPPSAGGTALR